MHSVLRRIIFLIVFSLAIQSLFAQDLNREILDIELEIVQQERTLDSLHEAGDGLKLQYISQRLEEMGWPSQEGELVKHRAMVLSYNEKHEQANWVAHMILRDVADGRTSRTNDFREDSLVSTGTAVEADYFLKNIQADGSVAYDGFGFDRGHIAPSADFRWNQEALSETYFYSNMSPQRPEFNREAWASLENIIRDYAINNNVELFVVTGPILSDDLEKIQRGIHKVSIPQSYFKVVYDEKNQRTAAFIMPNRGIEDPLEFYAMSLDEAEEKTGMDFFPNLEDSLEQSIESKIETALWLPGYEATGVRILDEDELGKGRYNTLQAYDFLDSNKKVTVCGTVVSTFKSKKGNVFINFDKKYPNTLFTATIWARDAANFSYQPEKVFLNKKVCARGEVNKGQTGLTMTISDEKHIEMMDGGHL